MLKNRSHWVCNDCLLPSPDQGVAAQAEEGCAESAGTNQVPAQGNQKIKILNLYAGIGGNRKHWQGVEVTAVEKDLKVLAAYKSLYPNDIAIPADAHQYLLKNFYKYDVIWSSYPCQSMSRMNYWLTPDKKRYPDLRMYSEILLLENFFKGVWIVENVDSYFVPLVKPTIKIGRHLFWSNIQLSDFEAPELFKDRGVDIISLQSMDDKKIIMDWLGIHYEKNIYLSGKNYMQVFRNCVHPDIGLSVFKDIIKHLKTVSGAQNKKQ